MDDAVGPERILELSFAFLGSKTLLSAVELGLFTELATRPATADELRTRLALHPRSARDFFDALVALGFLERTDGVYTNTAATNLFLDRNKPSYVGGMLEMCSRRLYGFWDGLTDALRTGQPQNEVKHGGPSLFETLYTDPARLASFLSAMTGLSHGANMAIAAKFPWAKYKTYVDAGTAQGDLAVQVALKHPHLLGIGLDLPVVKPIFEAYAQKTGVASRLTFVETI